MKYIVISDIHGSIDDLNKIIEIYNREKIDGLIILGDYGGYFHSSSDYEIAEVLNKLPGRIIAVKGNCDSEELNYLFNFGLEILREIDINGVKTIITHGHAYSSNYVFGTEAKIFISGHTHCGMLENINEKIIANPGSISKPRNSIGKSFLLINESSIILKKLDTEEEVKKTIYKKL